MKQVIIVALVCLNAALLVALVFGANTPVANAQVIGGGTNYLMMSGDIDNDHDAVYIIDLGKRRIVALRMDKRKGLHNARLKIVTGRDLKRDFGKTPE